MKNKLFKKLLTALIVIVGIICIFDFFDDDSDSEDLYNEYYGYDADQDYSSDDDYATEEYDEDADYDDYDDGDWLSWIFDLFSSDEDVSEEDDYSSTENASAFYSTNTRNEERDEKPVEAIPSGDGADWTVFIYLCGSDLETNYASGVTDLKEIMKASVGGNVNVLIQTGGSKKWHGLGISNKATERYLLSNGKLKKVQSLPKVSMGEASTLSDFISWGAKNYPAKKYAIDFWNHGSGSVYGVCFDENFDISEDVSDSILASEMKKALSDAGVDFELFIFDTCLSATIEMADTLSEFGKYMVASEEVVMSGCLSYDKWITSLSEKPAQNGAELGKQIAELYSKNMAKSGYASTCTMSVLNLSKIEYVKLAFQAMASQMTQKTQNVTSFRNLVRNGAKGVKYGAASDKEGYTNLIDLGEFATNAAAEVPEPAQALLAAIKNAVVYEIHGKDEGNSCGIAVYYPVKYQNDTDTYADNVDNRPYLQYLDAILEDWTAPSWVYTDKKVKAFVPVKKANYKIAFDTYITETDDDARFTLKMKSGIDSINSVTMNLYWYDEEAKEFLYLGNDDDIDANWDTGIFYDNFNAEWITIGDNYVNAELIENSEKYNYYSVPVELNGKDSNLRLRYDFEKDEFTLLGAYDGATNGSSAKGLRRLKEGDKLAFVFEAFGEDDDEDADPKSYICGEVKYTKDLEICFSELFDGLYYYQFEVEDIFGKVEYSDFVEMEYANGEISIAEVTEE